MKSTWFKKPTHYEFAQRIEDAGGRSGYRMYDLFASFLFFAYAAMRQAVYKLQTGDINAELEEEYLRQIKRYPEPNKFAEAMGMLVEGLEAEPHDFLGDVYQSLGMADKDFAGQCFTPESLCTMMAKMTIGDCKPDRDNRLTLNEPCVGGGAMAIAYIVELKNLGFLPWHYFLWATDIATACFHMSYVQLTLLGVPAIVTRGDALWPKETDEHAPTLVAALYPFRDSQRRTGAATIEITARTRTRPAQVTARTRTRHVTA